VKREKPRTFDYVVAVLVVEVNGTRALDGLLASQQAAFRFDFELAVDLEYNRS
jgi:hypothetical protein